MAYPAAAVEARQPPRVLCHGERGAPLLYLPSSGGDEHEFERYGMRHDLSPWIDTGRLRVWAVDGEAPGHLWNDAIPPPERIRRYARFERALAGVLLPAVAAEAGAPPLVVGASYGAFVAANLLFKHPAGLRGMCGLGGVYGLWHRLDGYHDEVVRTHTPLEYAPRIDEGTCEAIRRGVRLVLFSGERDEWRDSSLRMASILRELELPHVLDVWHGPVDHHELWWRRQLLALVSRRLGPA